MNLNQGLAILLVILGVLMASTAQLTDILGPAPAKYVVSIAGLLNSVLAGVLGVLTSQANAAKSVASSDVKLQVGPNAPQAIKDLATDPAQPNIQKAK